MRATGECTWAYGSAAKSRAQPAIQAAHHPASQASEPATAGETGIDAAAASESVSTAGMAGSATRFAGTLQTAMAPKCAQLIGAVAMLHAPDTAMPSARPGGIG